MLILHAEKDRVMISTELKMRIKNAVRNYNNCEENGFIIFELEEVAEELRDCLQAVLKENMNEMITNLK